MRTSSKKYRELDRTSVWHPYSRYSSIEGQAFPVIEKGKGIHLFDVEGNRYVDAVSSWWACCLGHGNRRVIRAIQKQASVLQHSILGNMTHPRAVELAVRLAGLFPGQPRKVLFAADGASAVEAALKIAMQYWHNTGHPERSKFVSLEDSYHGDTLGAVSVGRLEGFHRQYDSLLFPVYRADSPRCTACPAGCRPTDCRTECFESMRRMLEKHGRTIAAVIVEPLCQCAAGMRIYPADYLKKLAVLCRRHKVLLISDEIAVGFGRTGKMFAFEHAGIDPDIVCVGKGISAGYLPVSATIVKERIYRAFRDKPHDGTFYHGHTFTGNPITCAAALETMKIFEEDRIVARAAEGGAILAAEMEGLRSLPGVLDIRCLGMIAAVELGQKADDAAGLEHARRVRDYLLNRRILIRPLGSVVYLMPPLNTDHRMLRSLVKVVRDAIAVTSGEKAAGPQRIRAAARSAKI